jgi:hypothetical protein
MELALGDRHGRAGLDVAFSPGGVGGARRCTLLTKYVEAQIAFARRGISGRLRRHAGRPRPRGLDAAAQWGVMNHYLADWQARVHGLTMSVEQ